MSDRVWKMSGAHLREMLDKNRLRADTIARWTHIHEETIKYYLAGTKTIPRAHELAIRWVVHCYKSGPPIRPE